MEPQDLTDVFLALGVCQDFFVVCIHQECQQHTLYAYRRLDAVGDILLIGFRIQIGHILTGMSLVRHQVEVCSGGDAPQLTPSEGEQKFNVCGSIAVVRKLFRIMITQFDVIFLQSQSCQELGAEVLPICEPLQFCARLAEEFQFHLFEFSGPEDKVARCDLISERLTYLCDSERNLLSGSSLH